MSTLAEQSVYDVVVRLPKTMSPQTTVAQARQALDEDDHIHMLLLTEQGRLRGTLVRADLPPDVEGSSCAGDYAVLRGRTIDPGASAEVARRLLSARGERRRAVVDEQGQLLGLLCLKRNRTGFCSDEDVRSRAEAPR
jgi:CBS domain-containing protein